MSKLEIVEIFVVVGKAESLHFGFHLLIFVNGLFQSVQIFVPARFGGLLDNFFAAVNHLAQIAFYGFVRLVLIPVLESVGANPPFLVRSIIFMVPGNFMIID